MKCLYCKKAGHDRDLVRAPKGGYAHADGGGLYWQKCPECGWEGSASPSYVDCPTKDCPGNLRDHHVATPDRASRRGFSPPGGR